ncbi:MAG: SDR family NAD(P)-dependent oxidoreductase, partial [Phycisphaerales bacterium]|nr:SDR family NAD(P)-dependent oxidoreductase [Phycisphaerales bacterium]
MQSLRPSYDGRQVCVTGGAGFIGGHLVDTLMALGASVCVLDDLSNADASHLGELIEMEPDRIRFVHGSILDAEALQDATEEATVVFHLAAIGSVERSMREPGRTWDVNATGTQRVLEHARRVGAAVVLASSSSAYGDTPTLPKVETMPLAPRSPYAASKVAGEILLKTWAEAYDMSTASLRYFNIFGPRQRADSQYAAVIAAFCRACLGGEAPV